WPRSRRMWARTCIASACRRSSRSASSTSLIAPSRSPDSCRCRAREANWSGVILHLEGSAGGSYLLQDLEIAHERPPLGAARRFGVEPQRDGTIAVGARAVHPVARARLREPELDRRPCPHR